MEFERHEQVGGDLGDKMQAAIEECLESGADKVVIIGSDLPDISAGIIEEAFRALDESDIYVGPAHDGGFYLLGVRQTIGSLFNDIEWSTAGVCRKLLSNVCEMDLSVTMSEALRDLDDATDFRHFEPYFKEKWKGQFDGVES